MKEKIFSALKTKFSNLGFGDKAFDGVASYLATTITEEDKIETAISGVENLLKAFQSDADKIRTENANLKKQLEKPKDPPKEEKKEDPKKDDVPEWAKGLLESNKQLSEKLSKIESGKTTETRKSLLEKQIEKASDLLKGNVMKAFERMQFKDDEDFNAYLEDIKTDVAEDAKAKEDSAFEAFPKPASGGGTPTKEASKEEIAAIMALI